MENSFSVLELRSSLPSDRTNYRDLSNRYLSISSKGLLNYEILFTLDIITDYRGNINLKISDSENA